MSRNAAGVAVVVLGLVIVAGCSRDTANPSGAGSRQSGTTANTVVMSSLAFSPASMTVARGTTVTWRNDDGVTHTSTGDNGEWDTSDIPAGGSKTISFNTPGTFRYHCTYHRAMGMVGSITVQ